MNVSGFFRLIAAAVTVAATAACAPKQTWHTESGAVWGTTFHITYQSEGGKLTDSITEITEAIAESLSMFSPTSTVSRINAGLTDSADVHFRAVYAVAKKVAEASHGAFDPTVAPLVDLWGFGRGERDITGDPDSASIAAALEKIGILRTTLEDSRISKAHSQTEFDFSAIAKGYGVDCIADMLTRNGCINYMVEIGGEIRVSGHSPRGSNWNIAVDAPVEGSLPGDSTLTVLSLTDCALATSGNYRNYRQSGADSVVGHTINPHTGYPAPRRILSATVIAPDCTLADALATALMASHPDSAQTILSRFPSSRALIVLPDGKILTVD